ncbi:MAG: hypothetical protein GX161_03575 [Firmicutes bacterium]|nr:hypothetical protein [Bacillota bacterium]
MLEILAHRGNMHWYPENTLLSFAKALEAGSTMIETDLAMTADEHIVLIHDRTVDRTTDGTGKVADLTLEEIKQLDAGSWKGAEFAGQRIPTLAEALDFVGNRARFVLEIKPKDMSDDDIRRLLHLTCAVLSEKGALDNVIFSSVEMRALQLVLELQPGAKCLMIDYTTGLDLIRQCQDLGIYGWIAKYDTATYERVGAAVEAGLFTLVSLRLNLGDLILDAVKWGVHGFGTDNPALLMDFFRERSIPAP